MHRILVCLSLLGLLGASCKETKQKYIPGPAVSYVLSGGAGHYDYAPSPIQDSYGIRYVFLCENKVPFQIVDHIYLYKGIPTGNGYTWQPGTEVLAPSETGWDKIHVCDPDVRQFDVVYKGERYHWIMTYLGVDQWFNHNQIGLAFSKSIEGPYIKYDRNPLVSFADTSTWGVGQSTSIVLDSTSIRLFYSKSGGLMCVRDIQLNNLDSLKLGPERIVPFLHPNTYFAYSTHYIFAVSEIRINQKREVPNVVGNHVRLVYKPLEDGLFTKKDGWRQIGLVGPKESGFPRNHNPALLTDPRGYMLTEDSAIVYFTTAVTGDDWLWSYDLYSATFQLDTLNGAVGIK